MAKYVGAPFPETYWVNNSFELFDPLFFWRSHVRIAFKNAIEAPFPATELLSRHQVEPYNVQGDSPPARNAPVSAPVSAAQLAEYEGLLLSLIGLMRRANFLRNAARRDAARVPESQRVEAELRAAFSHFVRKSDLLRELRVSAAQETQLAALCDEVSRLFASSAETEAPPLDYRELRLPRPEKPPRDFSRVPYLHDIALSCLSFQPYWLKRPSPDHWFVGVDARGEGLFIRAAGGNSNLFFVSLINNRATEIFSDKLEGLGDIALSSGGEIHAVLGTKYAIRASQPPGIISVPSPGQGSGWNFLPDPLDAEPPLKFFTGLRGVVGLSGRTFFLDRHRRELYAGLPQVVGTSDAVVLSVGTEGQVVWGQTDNWIVAWRAGETVRFHMPAAGDISALALGDYIYLTAGSPKKNNLYVYTWGSDSYARVSVSPFPRPFWLIPGNGERKIRIAYGVDKIKIMDVTLEV